MGHILNILKIALLLFAILSSSRGFAQAQSSRNVLVRSQAAPLLVLSLVRPVSLLELEFMYKSENLPFNFGLVLAAIDFDNKGFLGKFQNIENNRIATVESLNLGLRVDFPFNGKPFTDSFYYSFAVLGGSFNSEEKLEDTLDCENKIKSKGTASIVAMTIGKQFFWDSGYHIMTGVGFFESKSLSRSSTNTNTCDSQDDISSSKGNLLSPWLDLAIGIAF